MFSTNSSMQSIVSNFHIDNMMRYSQFVPRLYNLCRSLGFEAGKIIPSRAFCSDENQGFPIILIAKHFGAFPFNHGRVGGIVATDRHGPHAHHGKDMIIIQASHVGYDPKTHSFGSYCRLQTTNNENTTTCGKIGAIIHWYQNEYRFAQNNIYLGKEGDICTITIDNHLLNDEREEGLFLNLDKLITKSNGEFQLLHRLSTSRVFVASKELCQHLPNDIEQGVAIGDHLASDMFTYHHQISNDIEGYDHLENNLLHAMPLIITSESPLLVAAQVNTQAEFDRAYRSIVKEPEYKNKRLLFISCLNIDISPREGQIFPLTKCIPWAAYYQDGKGDSRTLEQAEIIEMLMQQTTDNPDQIDLEAAIQQMIDAEEIKINI